MTPLTRAAFFPAFDPRFSLGPMARDGVAALLDRIEADPRWSDQRQRAYFLATVEWETGGTYQPVVERGSTAYFAKYNGRLGNIKPSDGFDYRGRGYVQLTGRENYHKFGILLNQPLEVSPYLACDPATAYKVATLGMLDGLFTAHKLSDYVNAARADYVSARRVVNGLDQAERIAARAQEIERALTLATA
ncbi:MAG: carboxypeptidase [Candidatus Velthaea sp.]